MAPNMPSVIQQTTLPPPYKNLAKLVNIVWQTLLFVFKTLAMDKKVMPDLNNVGQFWKYCEAVL